MTAGISQIGITASEQMFFGGAPLAHVVLYQELERVKLQARRREPDRMRQYRHIIHWQAQ